MKINDENISTLSTFEIAQPMWWSINIYDGPAAYEMSKKGFSRQQVLLFAIEWHDAEVNNGGYHQFYYNSTGIVWKDALDGMMEFGLVEGAELLRMSAARFVGSPSLQHGIRQHQLEKQSLNFDDIDKLFSEMQPTSKLEEYIRANRQQFYFNGIIKKPKP